MNIDKLEIEISAETKTATKNIESLSNSLTALSKSMGGLSNTDKLAQMGEGFAKLGAGITALRANTTKGTFKSLSEELKILNNTDVRNIVALGSSLKDLGSGLESISGINNTVTNLTTFADSLSKLGNKSVNEAITNLPRLAEAINKMIDTLSKAPAVNKDLTALIKSISDLASQGQKVGTAAKSISNNIKATGKSFDGFKIKVFSLSAIIGKLYADFWLLIRGAKILGKAMESAMSFKETMNYFDKTFETIGYQAAKELGLAGEESGKEFAEKFSKRAQEVTKSLSRLTYTDNGGFELSANALGMNGNETSKYQAQFAQIASSMGVATENAMTLSEVMTKLGGDLASIKDQDFEKTWQNLTSGLLGQSRTMYQYGANLTVSGLQQTLLELGIDTTVDKLSQQDKMLLRTIATLKSTSVAWGDLSDTLYSNSNQLRLLKSGWTDLTTIIGSMFMPMLKTLLPILNAVVIAVQRLALFIANLFGLNIGEEQRETVNNIEALGDYFDDVGSSASGAAKDVKKLKNQLLGIDELNVITTQDNSGGGGAGGGGGYSGALNDKFKEIAQQYLDAWKEANDKVDGFINNLAGKIEEKLKPIKDLFEDIKNGDWASVGKDLSSIFTVSVDGMTELLKKVDWQKVGQNIGDFLQGLEFAKMIGSVANLIDRIVFSALDLWAGSLTEAPIETILITAIAGMSFTKFGRQMADKIILAIGAGILGLNIGKVIGEYLFPEDKEWYVNFKITDILVLFEDPSVTFQGTQELIKEHPILGYILQGLMGPFYLPFFLTVNVPEGAKKALEWFSGIVNWLQEGWEGLTTSIGKFFTLINEKLMGLEEWFREKGLPAIKDGVKKLRDKFSEAINKIQTKWEGFVDDLKKFPDEVLQFLEDTETKVRNWWETKMKPVIDNFIALLKQDWKLAFLYVLGLIFNTFTKANVVANLNGMKEGFSGMLATVGLNTSSSLNNILESLRTIFTNDKVKEKLGGISNGFSSALNGAKAVVETICNLIKGVINSIFGNSNNFDFSGLSNGLIGAVSGAVSNASGMLDGLLGKLNQVNGGIAVTSTGGADALQTALLNNVGNAIQQTVSKATTPSTTTTTSKYNTKQTKASSIPTKLFASGGFPQVGSYFWAGEAGPELIGSVGGKTTVASNGEITGISDTIRSTSSAEMQLLRQQNELLMQLVAKPMGITESDIFNSVRKSANNYTQMTGNLAF